MVGLRLPNNPKPAPRTIYQRLDPRSVIYVPAPEEPEEELPYDELCWGGSGSGSGGDICQNYEEDTDDDEEPEDDCARIRGYADSIVRKEFLAIHGCEEDDPAEVQHFDEVSRVTQNWKIMDSGNETLYAIDQRINSIIFQKRDQEKKDGDEGGPGTSPDVIIRYPLKHPCSTAKSKPPIQPEEEGAPAPPPALPNKIQFNYKHPPLGEPMGGEGDTGGGPPPNDPPPPGTPPT